MGGMDFNAQAELEQQRKWELLLILQKMDLARQNGYFTRQDVEDVQREFGLTYDTQTQHT